MTAVEGVGKAKMDEAVMLRDMQCEVVGGDLMVTAYVIRD